MSFILQEEYLFSKKVTHGGGDMTLIFKNLAEKKVSAIENEMRSQRDGGDTEAFSTAVKKVLAGFGDDVLTVSGAPLEYTPENVNRLLDVRGMDLAVWNSFVEGWKEAAEKN